MDLIYQVLQKNHSHTIGHREIQSSSSMGIISGAKKKYYEDHRFRVVIKGNE